MAITGDRGADVCFDPIGGELADAPADDTFADLAGPGPIGDSGFPAPAPAEPAFDAPPPPPPPMDVPAPPAAGAETSPPRSSAKKRNKKPRR